MKAKTDNLDQFACELKPLVVNMMEVCSAILCHKETSGDQISSSLIGIMMGIGGQMIMESSFTLKNGLGSLVDGNHGPSDFKQVSIQKIADKLAGKAIKKIS